MLSIAAMIIWAISAALFAAYAFSVASEITYVTLADGRRTERRIPLLMRLLLPFTQNLNKVVNGRFMAQSVVKADEMILSSGLEGLITGTEFVALKILIPIACGTVWTIIVFVLAAAFPDSPFSGNQLPLALLGILFFYAWPLMWLRRTLKNRHREIVRALPFVLDLLTLSIEAGMDFMSAMQRNCTRRKLDALNEELIRMTHEIGVGISRRTALKNMADRVREPNLKSVAYSLIQADELGVSIGSILRIQSEQMRNKRFELAEKLANEAPVKMLGPLMLCIFPAVFVILLGPILMQAAKAM